MRTRLRAGMIAAALLMAPMAAVIPAAATPIPLEQTELLQQAAPVQQATPIWQVCTTPTPDLSCFLITLLDSGSASGSGKK